MSKKIRIVGAIIALIVAVVVAYWAEKLFFHTFMSPFDASPYNWEPRMSDYLAASVIGLPAGMLPAIAVYGIAYGVSMVLREKCQFCSVRKTERRTEEGQLICDECHRKKRLEEEPIRTCSVDGQEMTKEFVSDILRAKCPTCQGIWLNKEEAAVVRSRME